MRTRRYVLTLFAALLPFLALNAKEPDKKESDMPSFTWGARIGFAASGTHRGCSAENKIWHTRLWKIARKSLNEGFGSPSPSP